MTGVNALNGVNGPGFGMYNPYLGNYADVANSFDKYDSVFGGGYMNGGMPYNMGMGMGMPYGPSFYGGDYYNQMIKSQIDASKTMVDGQAKLTQDYRNANFSSSSKYNAVVADLAYLNMRAKSGDQTNIKFFVDKAVESLRELYPGATDKELGAEAVKMYKQHFGTDFVVDLKENSNSSFVHGIYQGATLGLLTDSITAEENLAALKGAPVARVEKIHKQAGRAVGGGILAAVATGLLALATKGRLKGKVFEKGLGETIVKAMPFTIAAGGVAGGVS